MSEYSQALSALSFLAHLPVAAKLAFSLILQIPIQGIRHCVVALGYQRIGITPPGLSRSLASGRKYARA